MAFFGKYSSKKKRRNTYARKRNARVGRKSGSVTVAVKNYVKRTIHSQIENKCTQINAGSGFGGVAESPDLSAYPMCPLSGYWSISQGVGQSSRIGNIIKARKVYLNYILTPRGYDATFNPSPQPMEIQLFLGYVKNTPCFIPGTSDIAELFQAGNTTTPPGGTIRDLVAVTNKDYWVIKKKWTHKLGFSNYQGTGGSVGSQYTANNDFKMNHIRRLDITKFCPATYQFNDTNISPTSKNLFFMYQAIPALGGAFGPTTVPANIEFWIDFHYEDA